MEDKIYNQEREATLFGKKGSSPDRNSRGGSKKSKSKSRRSSQIFDNLGGSIKKKMSELSKSPELKRRGTISDFSSSSLRSRIGLNNDAEKSGDNSS